MREFALLEKVFAANSDLPQRVTIPPGDDMGALAWPVEAGEVLVTVDQVAQGIHFSADTPLPLVARKAVTRNVSDVAAMACQPVAAVVAACLPRSLPDAGVQTLCQELRVQAARWGCPVIGGDVCVWDQPLLLSLTVLAQRWRPEIPPVRRGGARAGDRIYVTGRLGGSLLSGRHLTFEPRVELARKLVTEQNGRLRPTAMIDLSDGLARDLGHLCRMSGLQAQIHLEKLPIHPDVSEFPGHGEPWRHALGDGEDYELCFTVSSAIADLVPGELEGVALTCIGEMAAGADPPGIHLIRPDGSPLPWSELGWEHGS